MDPEATPEAREPEGPDREARAAEPKPASVPILEVRLDPTGQDASSVGRPQRGLSPTATALAGAVLGLALFGGLFAGLMHFAQTPRTPAPAPEAIAPPAARPGPTPPPSADAPAGQPPPTTPTMPSPWRVAELSSDPATRIVRGAMERRSLVDTLATSGVPRAQIYRLLHAFAPIRRFDKTHRKDVFLAALDARTRQIRAFEYEVGPTEIYQAREQADGTLGAERLDLHVEKRQVAGAVLVGDDLPASLRTGGFDPSLVEWIEDALEGRAQLSSLHPGARLRVLADEEMALGAFARYTDLSALDYVPAGADATSLRVYHFHGTRSQGYFDSKGHQPYKGGFRSPVPFARISSRFDMHRMHPVLHVVRPHNGVDFAAPSGTPVYAANIGRVLFVGDAGASGNLVTIQHANGVITGYAHLSRFAPHVHEGLSVETRQLIGYVGSTGRSTGPHLHFSAKKDGIFIDPMTLRLDGERVLPKPERADFDEQRAALDRALDAVAMPALAEGSAAPAAADAGEPQELDPDDEQP
jgi:murein DD-endopeptidase MepM/ murein hydrolase activator NlpD